MSKRVLITEGAGPIEVNTAARLIREDYKEGIPNLYQWVIDDRDVLAEALP